MKKENIPFMVNSEIKIRLSDDDNTLFTVYHKNQEYVCKIVGRTITVLKQSTKHF